MKGAEERREGGGDRGTHAGEERKGGAGLWGAHMRAHGSSLCACEAYGRQVEEGGLMALTLSAAW